MEKKVNYCLSVWVGQKGNAIRFREDFGGDTIGLLMQLPDPSLVI